MLVVEIVLVDSTQQRSVRKHNATQNLFTCSSTSECWNSFDTSFRWLGRSLERSTCGSGGSNDGSISLTAPENQLDVGNIATDGCDLNSGGNCDAISSSVVSCDEFCEDPTVSDDSSSSSSSSRD